MNSLQILKQIKPTKDISYRGAVTKIVGLIIESDGPMLAIGTTCNIATKSGVGVPAEIIGFRDNRVLLMPYGESDGIYPGSEVCSVDELSGAVSGSTFLVSEDMVGRIFDGLGRPMDDKPPIIGGVSMPLFAKSPNPIKRKLIGRGDVVETGIRAIDGLLTVGFGQRMGLFAGSGVGKSVLLGMIARNTNADVNVIGLIGERGREVNEFITRDLGAEGFKKSIVIVATGDQPPLVRRMAAHVTTAVAEYFRDKGKRVMLMMDSLTRVAYSQREIGLAAGEPPASKGFTPSFIPLLQKLLERAGTDSGKGSITGIYTVLVEADDTNDLVGDTVRSIIDGHIILSRQLSAKNHFPAIDVLNSASRLMKELVDDDTFDSAGRFRDLLATYNDAEALVNINAYVHGSNKKIDEALQKIDDINGFLRQRMGENIPYKTTLETIRNIIESPLVQATANMAQARQPAQPQAQPANPVPSPAGQPQPTQPMAQQPQQPQQPLLLQRG